MVDTVLQRPSPLFTQLLFTPLHYTCRHFASSHLDFTHLYFSTLSFALTAFIFPTSPFHLTSLHFTSLNFTALLDDFSHTKLLLLQYIQRSLIRTQLVLLFLELEDCSEPTGCLFVFWLFVFVYFLFDWLCTHSQHWSVKRWMPSASTNN
jgi:hypothetical protein